MKNLKKKVALLLAFVMVLSLVPMNVFGAPAVNVVRTTPAVTGISPAVANQDLPANTTGILRFDVPVSFFEGVLTPANWNNVSLIASLANRGHADGNEASGTRGLHVSVVLARVVNSLGQTISLPPGYALPGINNTPSSPRHDTNSQAFIPMTTGAGVAISGSTLASLATTPGGAFFQFEATVTNVARGNTTLALSVSGLPNHAPGTALLPPTNLVTRIAPAPAQPQNLSVTHWVDTPTRFRNDGNAQSIAVIEIRERTITTATPAAFNITLDAPRGYVWAGSATLGNTDGQRVNGWGAPSVTSLTRTSDGNGRENARLQATGVTIPNRSVSPLTQERGWLRITGAQLVPEADYTVRNENLRVTLNVTRNSASILHDIGMNEAVFTAAVQEIRDTRISSSVARVIESGVLSADIPGANDWDDEDDLAKTAVITLTEQAANSLMNAPVMIQINTPGVSIAGARARHTNNDGDWPDDDAWPTGITTMAPSMVIIDNPVGSGNRARARTAEIQLILQVAPGLGGIDIPAVVTIMTYPDTITSTEVIATIVDPIELSVDEVREIPVRNNAEFTFLPARRLGSVTVTPRNADVFKVDDVFNVFLRAVDAEGNAFSLPGLSMTWNVTAEVGGELFEVREGVPFNVPANFSSMLPHRIDGQQFEVSRVGTQVPSITFHSTLTGAMINEPGIQFELVVLGSAVQEHDQANVATTIVPMSLRAPYRIVVGKLVGELVLGEYEEEAAPPPPAPTPAPTPEPVVNEPARLDVNTAAVNSAGQPIFITSGDRTLVNLRGLFQDVLPNGSVTRADSISTFAAPSADGPMVQIMIPDPRLNEEPFIRTGGVPVPARVAAGFGLVAIDETWYVPMTVFTDLLGYLIN